MKKIVLKKGLYFDSVKLMLVTNELNKVVGVENAAVVMATELNKESLARVDMMTKEVEEASSTDLIIAIEASKEDALTQALRVLDEELNKVVQSDSDETYRPKSLQRAIAMGEDSNLLIISVPGQYAYDLADEALNNHLHVMMFSDNVPLEKELLLKKKAVEKDLLLMGPDCGTAHINGVPLCFSNGVRKGSVGLVAASGTGAQEVMTLIHKSGGGISQVIGTGGRDLKMEIGGLSTLQGIQALSEDENTKVIVLISKPPAEEIADKILSYVKERVSKPVVINFLGKEYPQNQEGHVYYEKDLASAAYRSLVIAGYEKEMEESSEVEFTKTKTQNQKYVKGLYSGGSLAYECLFLLERKEPVVYSNLSKKYPLHDLTKLQGHLTIDFGEDEFTQGRPHPMIDPTLRSKVFREVLEMEDTAAVVMDFMLGYGASLTPHTPFVEAYAQHLEKNPLSTVAVIANVCGTDEDPQNYSEVVKELLNAGFYVAKSNVDAALLAIEYAQL